jgi:hypothetical protein
MSDESSEIETDDRLIDLLAIVRRSGWSEARITALRNTCAAAATKDTLPSHERALAAAVASALSGRTPGISRADMKVLSDAGLF